MSSPSDKKDDSAPNVDDNIQEDPENQQPPSDQARNLRLRHGALSTTSRYYDRGNKGYLDETEELVRSYDRNGEGKIDLAAAMDLAHNARAKERKVQQTRTWAIVATVAAILFAAATFGLVWVALVLAKEVETTGDNFLVSTDSKKIVHTYNHGCLNHFEFIDGFLEDTTGDGRTDKINQSYDENGLSLIGEVPSTEVEETYAAISQDFHICTVIWMFNEFERARKIDPTNVLRSVDPNTGTITFDHFIVTDDAMGDINVLVTCDEGAAKCQVYEHQPVKDGRRLVPDCFSSNSSVVTENKGRINIMDLEVNDRVLTSNGSYSTVYSFLHRSVDQYAKALRIETETTAIELSQNHMIYLAGKELPVIAESIVVGDKLVRVSDDLKSTVSEVVIKITEVYHKGFVSPVTTNGDIVVDNILTSNFCVVGNKGTEYYYYHGEGSMLNVHSQVLGHVSMTPLRMACTWVSMAFCSKEYHNPPEHEDYAGTHFYSTSLLYLVKFGKTEQCGIILHIFLFAIVVGSCLFLYLMEHFLPAILLCGGFLSLALTHQKKVKNLLHSCGQVACKKLKVA